jgi:hypothetical protein
MRSKVIPIFVFLLTIAAVNYQCPSYGDSPSTDTKRRATNVLKNRKRNPPQASINNSVTLRAMLGSRDRATVFSQNVAARISGFLFEAIPEHGESCNCHSSNASDHDIHVLIAPSKTTSSKSQCVVIEITPWVKEHHPEWTVSYINHNKGKKVIVSGWLLHDWEHTSVSYATTGDPTGAQRGTVWEIHPLTAMRVQE